MSKRFINCSACRGCHTGRGGQYCPFILKTLPGEPAGVSMASIEDPSIPDRDSAEYEPYLAAKIEEEEERLKRLQERTRIAGMESQLASLRLRSAELEGQSTTFSSTRSHAGDGARRQETGVAAAVLTASKPLEPGQSSDSSGGLPGTSGFPAQVFRQRSKDEKEALSKLRAISHLAEVKPVEKITYRDYISAMMKVAHLVCEMGIDPVNYIAHMSFISGKAALNLYATDAMIKYESAVTERVISGQYYDWVAADPECVVLHLGADATYAVRQGGSRWSRPSSGISGTSRDFSDWPKEVCWLFNHTSCYFPRCRKAHICGKCKKEGHPMKDCKSHDESAAPNQPEVLSSKLPKEVRKP